MQEEVENRTVNLMISTTKLTGRSLVAAFRKYAQHRAKAKANKAVDSDHGKTVSYTHLTLPTICSV